MIMNNKYILEGLPVRMMISILIAFCVLLLPARGRAAEFKFDFHVFQREEGILCSELRYNENVIWRVFFLADDSKAVSGNSKLNGTVIAPSLVNGMFTLRLYRLGDCAGY